MNGNDTSWTYIGGPTAMFELAGLKFLTDPTFDPAGEKYPTALYTLEKTMGPSKTPESLGPIDVVLLSHDHHNDNLDRAGRRLLEKVGKIITTKEGAKRLGGNAIGLSPWESVDLSAKGSSIRVTGTPARHGPAGGDRGPVIGFVLSPQDSPTEAIYVSGDTVFYDGIVEISKRFKVRIAVLFMGAARVSAVGPAHLTFTAAEAIQAARLFGNALIVPLHYQGWAHFSESRKEIQEAFEAAGLEKRLRWIGADRSRL